MIYLKILLEPQSEVIIIMSIMFKTSLKMYIEAAIYLIQICIYFRDHQSI